MNPNTIIVRQGDSIERYRLNCAPNTTPTDYKNRVLENNQKDNVAVRQGDLLEVLVDDENANEWCQQRMNENRHLNE